MSVDAGVNGLILKGCYCSINVAVKRLLPPSNPSYPSIFGRTVAENQQKLQGGGVGAGPRVRRMSAAKRKSSDSRPSSPLLASTDSRVGSQHLLLCNGNCFSYKFICVGALVDVLLAVDCPTFASLLSPSLLIPAAAY